MALGKTCRYCTRCELIIAHQDELEAQLAGSLRAVAPEVIGNKNILLGTVEKRMWQRGVQGTGHLLGEILEHTADFNEMLDYNVERGGWFPASQT